MKRLLACILILTTVLMVTVAPLTMASAAKSTRSYMYVNSYKNGQLVRVRPEPNTNNVEITKLAHRAYVLVYEYNKQKTWALIEADDPTGSGTVKGWISAEFLSKKDPGPWKGNPTPDPVVDDALTTLSAVSAKIKPLEVPAAAEITTKNPTALVHLRWFPDTSAKYVDAFPRGTAVTVIAKSARWAQVVYTPEGTEEMHVGFVLADNVVEY